MQFTTHAKIKSARRIVLISLIGLALIEALGQMPHIMNYTYVNYRRLKANGLSSPGSECCQVEPWAS